MRRSTHGNGFIWSPIIETPDGGMSGGQIITINFGVDFCGEHESGIKELQEAFGISVKPARHRNLRGRVKKEIVGADVRTVTKVPAGLKFFPNLNGYAYLIYRESLAWMNESEFSSARFNSWLEVEDYSGEEFSAAWSWRDFGVRMSAMGPISIGTQVLGQVYDALINGDAMIYTVNTGNSFGGPGLAISIKSRVPQEVLDQMKEADLDRLNLLEAAEKTGIGLRLKRAGKGFFALSPRWGYGSVSTQYPVVFWLNPMEQDKNNYGLFTVEQLDEWILGKGPIPKVPIS